MHKKDLLDSIFIGSVQQAKVCYLIDVFPKSTRIWQINDVDFWSVDLKL